MDKDEFQQAVVLLRPQMAEQALRYLSEHDDAEDAVQEALIRLWQMHEQLHPPIDGLAKVLTRNVCIDLLRRRHLTLDASCIETEDIETADHERVDRMMAVVNTLPKQQQTILRLRHMQGMEMKELASMLNMNEAAVRKALSRARMVVRSLCAASVVLAVGLTAYFLFNRLEQDECVVFIYGQKTTDVDVVMKEMKLSAETMTGDNQEDEVESLLNEMFTIE